MRHILSFLGIFFALSLLADEIAVQAHGVGETYREAVNVALISALEQHNGVELSAAERASINENELVITFRDGDKTTIGTRDDVNMRVQKVFHGRISRYEITKENYDETTKKYTVDIVAYLPGDYKVPQSDPQVNRPRLAVGAFSRKADVVSFQGTNLSTETWTEMFSNALSIHLTQSRKFNILDRQSEAAVAAELKRFSSANANPADAVRLCKQLGTDYLLVGTMLFCDVAPASVNPYTGAAIVPASAPFVDITYRVILAPTGEVKWSDNVRVAVTEVSFANVAEFVAHSAELAATRVADGLLNALLPLELVEVSPDGRVIIGEGGVSLIEGEILTVYALGREVVDTRTGESLGHVEEKVGLVMVDRVTEKMSFGKLIEGDASKIEIGKTRLDRRTVYVTEPETVYPASSTPSQVRGSGNNGVVVPF